VCDRFPKAGIDTRVFLLRLLVVDCVCVRSQVAGDWPPVIPLWLFCLIIFCNPKSHCQLGCLVVLWPFLPLITVSWDTSSKILRERIHTGPHRVGPNRPGWARSVSALKLLNILRDVTGDVIIDGAPGLATPITLTLTLTPNPTFVGD